MPFPAASAPLMDRQDSLLLVEDDPRLRRLLERMLRNAGHQVTSAATGAEMMEQFEAGHFNLLILDRMLPDGDSVLLAQNLRQQSNIPIIMLTGKSDPSDKVLGLEVGADDYITKPFDESELLARVRSVLRRAHAASIAATEPPRSEIFFAGWELNVENHTLATPAGKIVPLSDHEFRLLVMFVENPNQPISRERIMETIMERPWTPLDRSVDVLVSKLRRKLKTDPKQPDLIQSVRGTGYRLCASVATS